METGSGSENGWRERVEEHLGATLERFSVLDDEQVEHWSATREALYRRGRRLGLKTHEGHCTNLYTGALSPGCQSCHAGTWSCLFVNGRCNRRCFYCPQELHKKESKERPSFEGSYLTPFQKPEDYIVFLRNLNYRGMSISGGEPFLTFDRSVEFIRQTREAFGPEMYIWAYTNGALYTRERGEQLRDAGLDELRFDISACEYDLGAVGEAVKTIPTVSVEIPAIPEDKALVLSLLPRLEELGVRFVNLHQLYTTRNNCEALADRGYTIIRDKSPAPPVLESEICALEIMCEALEAGVRLPINYCSSEYKVRFQSRGKRQRLIDFVSRNGVSLEMGTPTDSAVFRQLAVRAEPTDNRALVDRLRADGVGDDRYALADDASVVYLHPELLDHPALAAHHVFVSYYRYTIVRGTTQCSHEGETLADEKPGPPRIDRVGPVGELELHNDVARLGFHKMFVEGWSVPRTLRYLVSRPFAGPRQREAIEQCLRQMHEYGGRELEFIDPGFPAYA